MIFQWRIRGVFRLVGSIFVVVKTTEFVREKFLKKHENAAFCVEKPMVYIIKTKLHVKGLRGFPGSLCHTMQEIQGSPPGLYKT